MKKYIILNLQSKMYWRGSGNIFEWVGFANGAAQFFSKKEAEDKVIELAEGMCTIIEVIIKP